MKRRNTRRFFGFRSPCCLLICGLCTFIFWPLFMTEDTTERPTGIIQLFEPDAKLYLIKTEGCEIRAMATFDPSIKSFVNSTNVQKCDDPAKKLLNHNNTHIWIKKENLIKNITCCYKAFDRNQSVWVGSVKIDDRVRYYECINFTHHVKVNNEFLRVTCYNSTRQVHDQLFLFARKKKFTIHNGVKEKKGNDKGYNVLVMGIDSVSRLNLYRTMPKTVAFLKNHGAIELLGYNKVGDNTFPNLIPMLLGISVEELARTCVPHKRSTFDNCPFVWEWFKQAGYYTAFCEDSSSLGTFNYLRGGFFNAPTDYYIHTFMTEMEKMKRNKKLCSRDKYLYQVLLNYAKGLTRTLKSSKLFGFFWEVTMSHDYLNDAALMDDSYHNFMKTLHQNRYLDKTILILVSDHGMRWGNIRNTKQGRLEDRLPFVFVLTPPSFRRKYSEAFNNLKTNSGRLTTPFNVHATLNDLVNLDNISNEKILSRSREVYWSDRNISLFLAVPSNRTCQVAGISDHFCTCHVDVSISKSGALVKEASESVMKYLNQMLSTHERCARLSVDVLTEAREYLFVAGKANSTEVGWREFLVVMRARPGGGEFEATVRRYDDGQWAMAGPVSRLNLYGNQSYCVNDNILKLYCYCQTDLT